MAKKRKPRPAVPFGDIVPPWRDRIDRLLMVSTFFNGVSIGALGLLAIWGTIETRLLLSHLHRLPDGVAVIWGFAVFLIGYARLNASAHLNDALQNIADGGRELYGLWKIKVLLNMAGCVFVVFPAYALSGLPQWITEVVTPVEHSMGAKAVAILVQIPSILVAGVLGNFAYALVRRAWRFFSK